MIVTICIIGYLIFAGLLIYILDKKNTQHKKQINRYKENKLIESGCIKPQFKELTQEQIDEIHSRGKITPAEKVNEWEGLDLCAPGDAIGSAAWRCKKFNNCHDCLVDYANDNDEYESFFKDLKIICK